MRAIFAAILSIALLGGTAAPTASAQQAVDLELVLLADASGSIDEAEIRFQRAGYAAAIAHPDVLAAIAGGGFHQRIAVTYVEWGDANHQAVVAPWTVIDGPESAAAFGRTLMAAPRQAFGRNAIGSAIAVAQALIEGNSFSGVRKVIDLSADSAYSWGGVPLPVARQSAIDAGLTINGLAILCRERDCSGRPADYDVEAAFAQQIIGGAGAFVVSVESRARFTEAVRKKLLLEIAARQLHLPQTLSQ
jgi:hypothetical protein